MYFVTIVIVFALANGMTAKQEVYYRDLYESPILCTNAGVQKALEIEIQLQRGEREKPAAGTGDYDVQVLCYAQRHRIASIY